MKDYNESDPSADRAEPSEDEEIIELTEEITNPPEEDDEIIELTDIVDKPFEEDEDIIELEEVADAAGDAPDEEEILELTEVADVPEEEELLELTDLADESSKVAEEEPELADIFQDEAVEINESVDDDSLDEELGILQDLEAEPGFGKTDIELETENQLDELESLDLTEDIEFEEACSKIKETAFPDEPETMEPAAEFEPEAEAHEMEPVEPAEESEPDEAQVIEISERKTEDQPHREYVAPPDVVLHETTEEQELVSEFPPVSSEQIEEALERVIKKMYAEKIDHILVEVIEKTVTREIEKLKRVLLDDTE